jgi:hypothetical protein
MVKSPPLVKHDTMAHEHQPYLMPKKQMSHVINNKKRKLAPMTNTHDDMDAGLLVNNTDSVE